MVVDRTAISRVFERAPVLVAQLVGEAPFATVEAFLTRARTYIDGMSVDERIAVLNAHPRIGEDPRALSPDSKREQGGREDKTALDELEALNRQYERRMGFRFVVFVAGRPHSAIVPILRERLLRTRDEELATGLNELLAIARDRLSQAR